MSAQSEHEKHPTVTEHPEQRRQEETGREDASEPGEVGRPPSSSESRRPTKKEDAA
jgi:hypothetical protein